MFRADVGIGIRRVVCVGLAAASLTLTAHGGAARAEAAAKTYSLVAEGTSRRATVIYGEVGKTTTKDVSLPFRAKVSLEEGRGAMIQVRNRDEGRSVTCRILGTDVLGSTSRTAKGSVQCNLVRSSDSELFSSFGNDRVFVSPSTSGSDASGPASGATETADRVAAATTTYPGAPALSNERLTVGPRHVVFVKRGVVTVLDLDTGRLGDAPYDGRISEVTIAGDRLVAIASGGVVLSASITDKAWKAIATVAGARDVVGFGDAVLIIAGVTNEPIRLDARTGRRLGTVQRVESVLDVAETSMLARYGSELVVMDRGGSVTSRIVLPRSPRSAAFIDRSTVVVDVRGEQLIVPLTGGTPTRIGEELVADLSGTASDGAVMLIGRRLRVWSPVKRSFVDVGACACRDVVVAHGAVWAATTKGPVRMDLAVLRRAVD